jgi:homoserine kinase
VSDVVRLRAPASVANLGAGFDCVAAAVDLWNELEVRPGHGVDIEGEDADRLPRDDSHLGLEAFSLFSSTEGYGFRFVNRIPIGRGLGSSATTIALGLYAGALVTGAECTPEALLDLGVSLEGHADNLAASLKGGVCAAWQDDGQWHVRRLARTLPFTLLEVVPAARVGTESSRHRLPDRLPHTDASFAAARALLLGAGLASRDPGLVAKGFTDRLHEPYRIDDAPLLAELRSDPPAGAIGVTLSGSGPSVTVWADPRQAERCLDELRRRLPRARVLRLDVAPSGIATRPIAAALPRPYLASTSRIARIDGAKK